MANFKHLLVAMDETPASRLLLEYVTDLAGGTREFRIHLFHAMGMPPGLLESPGADHPEEQNLVQERLERQQEEWQARARSEAETHFKGARATLTAANIPDNAIETHLGVLKHKEDLASQILKAAREHNCGTIVVGRSAYPWLMELFQTHTGEKLVSSAKGIAVCVVD
jgi:nucleotide-binding universal stress UspA family protein